MIFKNYDDDDKQEFVPDSSLSEQEFLTKYGDRVHSGLLTVEYLRMRWKWMNKQASWEEVHKEYSKTRAYKENVERAKNNSSL